MSRRVANVDTTPILTAPWPDDLDSATVPFTKRTVTVLERQGIYTNPVLLNRVTVTDVLGWWNAGPVTVEDLSGSQATMRSDAITKSPASSKHSQLTWRSWPHNPGLLTFGITTHGSPGSSRRVTSPSTR